jgi:cell wall-associated NlpC family hydrolase
LTRTLFPRLFVAGLALGLAASATAQTNDPDSRPRIVLTNKVTVKPIESAPAPYPPTKNENRAPLLSARSLGPFNTQLLAAIESYLGSSYHFNTTGPDSFDCSGFVWRAFQDVGVNFQRGPARSYWATMPAPPQDEQFKFGTLVFFSGLTHVGIVDDEKGFYHSARHGGVVYSPFNDYWLSRIDGFRRVPLDGNGLNAKVRNGKSASVQSVEEDNVP